MHCKVQHVSSVNPTGPSYVLAPVKSMEERSNYKQAWFFRLAAEMQDCINKGWKIGFFTLTYNNENVPYIPASLFKPEADFELIQCFNRQHVRDFIVSVRKWFFDKFNIKGIKYFIASELGSSATKRPHYHGLISWPPVVDANLVHSLIKDRWKYGFVFPRDFRGGFDSHGYLHKSFELSASPILASRYASKYVCKDLTFLDSIRDKIMTKNRWFRNIDCFHIQSKSLGFCVLQNATDEQKMSWLKDGFWLPGAEKAVNIPVYIRNKIFFNPYYVLGPDGNRLVRRSATQFLVDNYREIFDLKVASMTKFFEKVGQVNWWFSQVSDKSFALEGFNRFTQFMKDYNYDFRGLASDYLSVYGILPSRVVFNDPAKQWVSRYFDFELPNSVVEYDSFVEWNNTLGKILGYTRWFNDLDLKEEEKLSQRIAEYWKSTA